VARSIVLGALAWTLLAWPAAAMTTCVVGSKVKLPSGNIATVVSTSGSSCTVGGKDQYGNALDGVWSASMLAPADSGSITVSNNHDLSAGRYQCYGNGNYLFIDLNIKADGSYSDGNGASGRFSYYADGGIDFSGGPFSGYGGEALDGFVYLQQPGTQSRIQCRR
jgi:hypothetical protein